MTGDFKGIASKYDPPALLGASNYLRSEEGGETARRTIRPGFEPTMDAIVEATREAKRWIEQHGLHRAGIGADHPAVG